MYGSAYLLTGVSSNLFYGRIYKFYPTKLAFLGSLFVFEIGSLICSIAPFSVSFIIRRDISGIGISGVQSGGIMILCLYDYSSKTPLIWWLLRFCAAIAFSASLGPLIGGAITDHLVWCSCFYISLPISGFNLLAMILWLHIDKPQHKYP